MVTDGIFNAGIVGKKRLGAALQKGRETFVWWGKLTSGKRIVITANCGTALMGLITNDVYITFRILTPLQILLYFLIFLFYEGVSLLW